MNGRRWRRVSVAAAGAVVAATVAGLGASSAGSQGAEVNLAMISPLTGPLSFVGLDNRKGVEAAVREINGQGGIRKRKIRLTILDDGSNPSQGVVHMRRVASDSKFVGVIGSGFSSVGLAVAPIVEQSKIPYISMASSAAQVTPAKPYYYMTTATSRLFAYAMAQYLRKAKIRRIALVADNGGFGREGVRNVNELKRAYQLEIVSETIFPLTTTSFTAELSRIKNSNAQAIWLWNATTLAVTLTKEMRQLRLPQRLILTGGNASTSFLGPACPEANGALIDTYLGPVAQFLPKSNKSRAIALRVNRLIKGQGSTFSYDGYTAVQMFKRAMMKGGFSRDGINGALEGKMKGFIGPGGTYFYSPVNHSGLKVRSMVVSQVKNCKMVPVKGQNLRAKR
jgi:branched-chain amino acid transport system substrate-binding protein